jgi:hypothetical protein
MVDDASDHPEHPPRRWRRLLIIAGAAVLILALGIAALARSNQSDDDSESLRSGALTPVSDEEAAHVECVFETSGWIDDISSGAATIDDAAFELGMQNPRFRLVLDAYNAFRVRAYRYGAADAADYVHDTVIVPRCDQLVPTTTTMAATTTVSPEDAIELDDKERDAAEAQLTRELRADRQGDEPVDCEYPSTVNVGDTFSCTYGNSPPLLYKVTIRPDLTFEWEFVGAVERG